MSEFICDTELLVQLIEKLEWATKGHRIFWHKDSANKYRINRGRTRDSLDKFAISFSYKDAEVPVATATIYVNSYSYKVFSPYKDADVFEASKKLEVAIRESMKCAESTLADMMEALKKL